MQQTPPSFIKGGIAGIIFMMCSFLFILGTPQNDSISPVAMRILAPAWSTKTIRYSKHIQELADTDERYAQCKTDMDACADTSLSGNLPFLIDMALWFCIGGCVSLLINFSKRRLFLQR